LIGAVAMLQDSNAQIKEKEQQTTDALGREREASDKLKVALAWERETSYIQRIRLAHSEWLANHVSRAKELLAECPTDLRSWEWHFLNRLFCPEQVIFHGHAKQVKAVEFSLDGTRVVSSSTDATKVWDSVTGKEILTLPGHNSMSPTGVAIS